jgi:hypothetical protein
VTLILGKDKCECVPWKYPGSQNISELCDIMGNLCFKDVLVDGNRLKDCSCFSDCSGVTYNYIALKEPLDPLEICRKSSGKHFSGLKAYLREYLSDVKMTKFFGMYTNISQGFVFDPAVKDNCEDRIVNDIAIVDIFFGSQFATVYEQDVRTTMTGKFSEVGEFFVQRRLYQLNILLITRDFK